MILCTPYFHTNTSSFQRSHSKAGAVCILASVWDRSFCEYSSIGELNIHLIQLLIHYVFIRRIFKNLWENCDSLVCYLRYTVEFLKVIHIRFYLSFSLLWQLSSALNLTSSVYSLVYLCFATHICNHLCLTLTDRGGGAPRAPPL